MVYNSSGKHISALAEENNKMWVGTDGGILEIEKTTGVSTFYNIYNSELPKLYYYEKSYIHTLYNYFIQQCLVKSSNI